KDPVHKFITKATGGRFAHAAVYVHRYEIFEATRTGVGFDALVPERIEFDAENTKRVLCSTKDFDEIAVYRCPPEFRKPPSDSDDKLVTALFPILYAMNGLEYKQLTEFANIKTRLDWIPKRVRAWFLKPVGNAFLKDHKKGLIEEFFCSELILHALQEVGMTIMKQPGVCPAEVSPKDLADSATSNLVEVPEALRPAD